MNALENTFNELCAKESIAILPKQLELIKEYSLPLLRQVERACQKAGYTYHGIEHVNHLGRIMYHLIPSYLMSNEKNKIGPYELLILMGAAYTHDLGMLMPADRAIHNIVSANKVYDSAKGISLIEGLSDQYAHFISDLCRAHRDHKEKDRRINTLDSLGNSHVAGRDINIKMLACLFRLADELDSDFERAPEDLELSLPLSSESQQHWITHQLIDSISIDSTRWEINLYPSESAKLDHAMMQLVEVRKNKINDELKKMHKILKDTPFAYDQVTLEFSNKLSGEVRVDSPVTATKKNSFFNKVQELFSICGYQIDIATDDHSTFWDFKATPIQGLNRQPTYVKCSEKLIDKSNLSKLTKAKETNPFSSLVCVTSEQMNLDTITQGISLGIQCYSYDQLVVRMINFYPYIDRVINDPDLLNLENEYVQPFIDSPTGKRLAWEFLDEWLAKSTSNWLTILGDYGVGKTALLQMLLLRLMRKYRAAPENQPIPILIPLQNFVKSFTFRNLVLALFEDIGLSGVYYDAFEDWVKRGRVILLLDSFDEMAQKLGRNEIQNNLRELMSGITGQSKAILTSRPTYFESGAERLKIFADVNLIPEDHEDYTIYRKFSEYDLQLEGQIKKTSTIQLSDLTEEQRNSFFRKALRNSIDVLGKLEKLIYKIEGLAQMTERPVIARLLMIAAPGLRDSDIDTLSTELNEASIFKLIVTQLLRRDETLFGGLLTNSERHLFLKELSYIISKQGNDNYVSNQTIRNLVNRLFAHKISSHETPEIIAEQYFRTCRRAAGLTVEKSASGLSRDIEDPESRVGFSHNALREYIYAEFIKDQLFTNRASSLFQASSISEGTQIFLKYMLNDQEIQKMITGLQAFDKLRGFYFDIIWRLMPNKERDDIITIMNDPPNFSELDLSNLDLSDRDLTGAEFSQSLIGGTNFIGSILVGASFKGAILEMAAFDDSTLDDTNFASSDIISIVVYNPHQKRSMPLFADEARQWLYTSGSEVGYESKLNILTRSAKYRIAQRILRKMARYNFGATYNEMGLLRGLSQINYPIGREFMSMLNRKGYLEFVRKAAIGGRGADVILVRKDRRQDLQFLYNGQCPKDLLDFFDDLH